VSIAEWRVVVALACGAGIVGLPLAVSAGEGTITVLGAVVYAFPFIKHDRLDQMEH
jgi:hypothetical protein